MDDFQSLVGLDFEVAKPDSLYDDSIAVASVIRAVTCSCRFSPNLMRSIKDRPSKVFIFSNVPAREIPAS
jgi:hypothetical protein